MDAGPFFYMNSFVPLVSTPAGLDASKQYRIPPFVDGSIRREPDFEHDQPAITCLCRAGKFAPRLRVGDVVAYVTNKGRYDGAPAHRRLVAVLKVLYVLSSHGEGAKWYRSNGQPLPNNCMVRGNAAKPFDQSHQRTRNGGCHGCAAIHRTWDREYQHRARTFSAFVVCEPLFQELSWEAPILHDDVLIRIFGRIPGMQNPGRQSMDACRKLMSELGISAPPSAL